MITVCNLGMLERETSLFFFFSFCGLSYLISLVIYIYLCVLCVHIHYLRMILAHPRSYVHHACLSEKNYSITNQIEKFRKNECFLCKVKLYCNI
jgi:hypothetical protein